MKEPKSNMGLVCKGCLKPDPNALNYELEWFIGKHVKIAFHTGLIDGVEIEHMWVDVGQVCNGRGKNGFELIGTLDNDPKFFSGKCGDGVYLNRTQIEKVLDGDIEVEL